MTGAPVFEDGFDAPELDRGKWLPLYLPHWSEPARTAPSYAIADGVLSLSIAADQPEWCPDLDPGVRVSNLQTGHWSGPLGQGRGQHRFRSGLTVRTALPPVRLFLMHRGKLELRARVRLGPGNLAALWLIGFEDRPERSGEITVMEVFGFEARDGATRLNCGIKAITDPRLSTEIVRPVLPFRIEDWHDYAIDWRADGIRFLVDGAEVHRSAQSPDYPMQLMLNLYALPGGRAHDPAARLDIDHVRVWA